MSVQVEQLEHNMAKLTIEVSVDDFDKAVQKVYLKQRGQISIPGFRKGKTPRSVIEKMYGAGIFYEDAANDAIQQNYPAAVSESELTIVSQPKIDITQIEEGKPFIFTAEVAVKPEVTLGEYKGVEVPKADLTVTDEDVDEEVKKEQDKNARTLTVEDRPSKEGDTVIPGFEEQLIGRKPEENVDVNVTFPDDYQAEDLQGKEAVFKCVIHKIEAKELPELDDEFAQDVSEFDTMDEYKADVRKNLQNKKEEEAKRAKEDAVVDKVIENATMDIPDAMIDTQVNQMIDDFGRRIQSQGLTMEQYLQFTGSTMDNVRDQMKPQAQKSIQSRLVLEKVAEEEKIEIAEDKLDKEIKDMAETYKMEPEKFRDMIGDYEKEQMKQDLAVQEAITLLTDNAVEK